MAFNFHKIKAANDTSATSGADFQTGWNENFDMIADVMGAKTFYIDPVNGSDANSGLGSSEAVKTLNKLFGSNGLCSTMYDDVTIELVGADLTFTEVLSLSGYRKIRFMGSSANLTVERISFVSCESIYFNVASITTTASSNSTANQISRLFIKGNLSINAGLISFEDSNTYISGNVTGLINVMGGLVHVGGTTSQNPYITNNGIFINGTGTINLPLQSNGGGGIESVNGVLPDISNDVTIDATDMKMDKADPSSLTVYTFTHNMYGIVGDSDDYVSLNLKLFSEGFLTI